MIREIKDNIPDIFDKLDAMVHEYNRFCRMGVNSPREIKTTFAEVYDVNCNTTFSKKGKFGVVTYTKMLTPTVTNCSTNTTTTTTKLCVSTTIR